MITRADIEQALAAYWQDPVRDFPADHPAVRALFERAEREEAVRERTLRGMFLPSQPELLGHFVAEIHATLCDADNRSCVAPERLEAAGQAVCEIIVQCQANTSDLAVRAGVLEHAMAQRAEISPEAQAVLDGREERARDRLAADSRLGGLAADRRAALEERVRIVRVVRAHADRMREEAWTPSVGVAMAAIVDSVADMINTMEDS